VGALGRADGLLVALVGDGGFDPASPQVERIWRLEYALSASNLSGLVRGRPGPTREIRSRSMSGSNASESWRCPAVVTRASGRHRESDSRWILVLSPPRERPSPSRSRRGACPVGGLLSFDAAPCVTCRVRRNGRVGDRVTQQPDQLLRGDVLGWLMARTRGVLVCADHGRVHPDRPLRVLTSVTPDP
jgi:hypothetical protein